MSSSKRATKSKSKSPSSSSSSKRARSAAATAVSLSSSLQWCGSAGRSHDDTRHWQSWQFGAIKYLTLTDSDIEQFWHSRVVSVTVWADDRWVWALQWLYEDMRDGTIMNDVRVGATKEHTCGTSSHRLRHSSDRYIAPQTLTLGYEEWITGVKARLGNIMDQLTITTNTGRSLTCGGWGGSEHTWVVPRDCMVIGMRGGSGGHIHHGDVLYRPVIPSSSSRNTAHADAPPSTTLQVLQRTILSSTIGITDLLVIITHYVGYHILP